MSTPPAPYNNTYINRMGSWSHTSSNGESGLMIMHGRSHQHVCDVPTLVGWEFGKKILNNSIQAFDRHNLRPTQPRMPITAEDVIL